MMPGQLVKAVSIAMDVPEETVVQHDRNLVVAGLRTTGARGRHAPHVTPLDAARLLVATLASVKTKDSVEIVEGFEQTFFAEPGPPRKRLSCLANLRAEHSFIEALAVLIGRASVSLSVEDVEQIANITIECSTPSFGASIDIDAENQSNLYLTAQFASMVIDLAANLAANNGPLRRRPGISQTRTIDGSAILIIGAAFRENGLNYPTSEKAIEAVVGMAKAKKTA